MQCAGALVQVPACALQLTQMAQRHDLGVPVPQLLGDAESMVVPLVGLRVAAHTLLEMPGPQQMLDGAAEIAPLFGLQGVHRRAVQRGQVLRDPGGRLRDSRAQVGRLHQALADGAVVLRRGPRIGLTRPGRRNQERSQRRERVHVGQQPQRLLDPQRRAPGTGGHK